MNYAISPTLVPGDATNRPRRGAGHARRDGLATLACLLACAWALPLQAAIPSSERQVLIDLYSNTAGGHWTDNTNWCSGTCPAIGIPTFNAIGSECTWHGIACDAGNAHVTGIALGTNNLTGALPALGALTALSSFDGHSNVLTGSLPSLTGLPALTYFDASANQLTGPIPPLATTLVHFDVFNNQLSGSLPSLAGLASLEFFAADSNQLSGPIPPSLSNATALRVFVVDSNGNGGGSGLTGSIPALSALTNLQNFSAFNNQLGGTIPSLSGLTALTNFAVNSNQLTGGIPSLAGLTALQNFVVYNNMLSGPIPSLSGLPALQIFKVDTNALSGSVPVAPSSLLAGQSTLCPNPLSISASPNDAGWDAATGITPWWGSGVGGSACSDVIFANGFESP